MTIRTYRLDRYLIITTCGDGGFQYKRLHEDLVGGKMTIGRGRFGDDGTPVLIVDPFLTRTLALESSELEEWQQECKEVSVWDKTPGYNWEYAPGPWADHVEAFEEIAVMSTLY